MSDKISHVTEGTFDAEVLQADAPVLVDFWAEWCPPCKAVAPILDEIAEEFDGRVTIAKVDVDDNPSLPNKYGIQGIPTMLLFKKGEVAATQVGAAPKGELVKFLENNI
jgi:thioredoxin 1